LEETPRNTFDNTWEQRGGGWGEKDKKEKSRDRNELVSNNEKK
jgi:hypothetical protein